MNTTVNMFENVWSVLPAKYWIILALAIMGLFLIGFDQGETLNVFMDKASSGQMYLHELFHDSRHALGFACH